MPEGSLIPVFGRSARAQARAVLASIAKCWHLAVSQGDAPCPPSKGRYVMKRDRKVTVRLSEDELRRLRKLVGDSGWSQEAYLRALIEGVVPAPRPPPDYRAMALELRRIGVNLNQMARRMNAGVHPDAERLASLCSQVEAAVAEVVDAVTSPRRMEWQPHRSGK